ncbi:unnamed protein product [Sphagnum jensenii]|uniref:Uncharacterized protein n=1 Tax=Sphagnum jensenii TaxID=128206 RepID=A0ABP0XH48_9BRYO
MAPNHGSKTGARHRNSSNSAAAAPATAILAEARRLKQAAERKPDGIVSKQATLEQSARLFQDALNLPLSLPIQEEALFDLGEVFLLWSSSLQARRAIEAGSPFRGKIKKDQALDLQYQISINAANLSRQSFEMYERVWALEGRGELKQEALVNSGNSLCDWASLLASISEENGGGIAAAAERYNEADKRYAEALTSTPEDVELLTNVGDICVQRAELTAMSVQQSGAPSGSQETWAAVRALYERGLQAYAAACAHADARVGDDVAGLLQNWGAGLLSLAERTPDLEESKEAYKGAQEKLRSAISFRPTDASLPIALGETLCSQAERFGNHPALQPEVLKLLEEAVNDGFGAALKINSSNIEALLGLGDAHLAAGKLLHESGNPANAMLHWVQSSDAFLQAVKLLSADTEGEYTLSFEEQCDALYNLACAAALAGQQDNASKALHQLEQVDAISAKDLSEDSDLKGLQVQDWFVEMIQRLTPSKEQSKE